MRRVITVLFSLFLIAGCGPRFPFILNLIPFLDAARLEHLVEVSGGSADIPGSEAPPLTFPRVEIPLHDITIPVDVGLSLPQSPISSAEVILGVVTDIVADPDTLDLDGSAVVSLYLAPESASDLFVSEYEVQMGTIAVGNGAKSTLIAPLPGARIADLEGGPILLGLGVRSIAVGFPELPAEDHTLYGFALTVEALTIRGEVESSLGG